MIYKKQMYDEIPSQKTFEDDFRFPKVGYVSFSGGYAYISYSCGMLLPSESRDK